MIEPQKATPDQEPIHVAGHLLHQIIGIVGWLIAVPLLLLVLVVFLQIGETYVAPMFGGGGASGTIPTSQGTIVATNTLLDQLMPLVAQILRLVIPIILFVLLLALSQVVAKSSSGATVLRQAITDLPSLLALLIVSTICVLPIAGIEIPETLKSVALVVVGFYFGKRNAARGSSASVDDE